MQGSIFNSNYSQLKNSFEKATELRFKNLSDRLSPMQPKFQQYSTFQNSNSNKNDFFSTLKLPNNSPNQKQPEYTYLSPQQTLQSFNLSQQKYSQQNFRQNNGQMELKLEEFLTSIRNFIYTSGQIKHLASQKNQKLDAQVEFSIRLFENDKFQLENNVKQFEKQYKNTEIYQSKIKELEKQIEHLIKKEQKYNKKALEKKICIKNQNKMLEQRQSELQQYDQYPISAINQLLSHQSQFQNNSLQTFFDLSIKEIKLMDIISNEMNINMQKKVEIQEMISYLAQQKTALLNNMTPKVEIMYQNSDISIRKQLQDLLKCLVRESIEQEESLDCEQIVGKIKEEALRIQELLLNEQEAVGVVKEENKQMQEQIEFLERKEGKNNDNSTLIAKICEQDSKIEQIQGECKFQKQEKQNLILALQNIFLKNNFISSKQDFEVSKALLYLEKYLSIQKESEKNIQNKQISQSNGFQTSQIDLNKQIEDLKHQNSQLLLQIEEIDEVNFKIRSQKNEEGEQKEKELLKLQIAKLNKIIEQLQKSQGGNRKEDLKDIQERFYSIIEKNKAKYKQKLVEVAKIHIEIEYNYSIQAQKIDEYVSEIQNLKNIIDNQGQSREENKEIEIQKAQEDQYNQFQVQVEEIKLEHQNEIMSFQQNLNKIVLENNDLKQISSQFQQKCNSLEQINAQIQGKIAQCRNENLEIQKESFQKDEIIRNLEGKIKENQMKSSNFEDILEQNKLLQGQRKTLEDEIFTKNQQIEKNITENQQLLTKIIAFEQLNMHKRNEAMLIQQKEALCIQYLNEISTNQAQISQMKAHIEHQERLILQTKHQQIQTEQAFGQIKEQIGHFQDQIKHIIEEKGTLEQQKSTLEEQVSFLEQQNGQLELKNKENQEKLQNCIEQAQKESILYKNNNQNEYLEIFRQKEEEFSNKSKFLEDKIEIYVQENEKIQYKMRQLEEKNVKNNEEILQKEQQIQQIICQNSTKENIISQKNEILQQKNEKIAKQESLLSEKDSSLAILKKEIQNANQVLSDQSEQIKDSQKDLQNLRKTFQDQQTLYEQSSDQQQEQINLLNTNIQDKEVQINILQQTIETQRQQMEMMLCDLNEQAEYIQQLQTQPNEETPGTKLLSLKNRIADIEEEHENHIMSINNNNINLNQQIVSLKAQIEELIGENEDLEQKIEDKENFILALQDKQNNEGGSEEKILMLEEKVQKYELKIQRDQEDIVYLSKQLQEKKKGFVKEEEDVNDAGYEQKLIQKKIQIQQNIAELKSDIQFISTEDQINIQELEQQLVRNNEEIKRFQQKMSNKNQMKYNQHQNNQQIQANKELQEAKYLVEQTNFELKGKLEKVNLDNQELENRVKESLQLLSQKSEIIAKISKIFNISEENIEQNIEKVIKQYQQTQEKSNIYSQQLQNIIENALFVNKKCEITYENLNEYEKETIQKYEEQIQKNRALLDEKNKEKKENNPFNLNGFDDFNEEIQYNQNQSSFVDNSIIKELQSGKENDNREQENEQQGRMQEQINNLMAGKALTMKEMEKMQDLLSQKSQTISQYDKKFKDLEKQNRKLKENNEIISQKEHLKTIFVQFMVSCLENKKQNKIIETENYLNILFSMLNISEQEKEELIVNKVITKASEKKKSIVQLILNK